MLVMSMGCILNRNPRILTRYIFIFQVRFNHASQNVPSKCALVGAEGAFVVGVIAT